MEPWVPQYLEGVRARKTPPGGAVVPVQTFRWSQLGGWSSSI